MLSLRTLSARVLLGSLAATGPLYAQQTPAAPPRPLVEPDPNLLQVQQPPQPAPTVSPARQGRGDLDAGPTPSLQAPAAPVAPVAPTSDKTGGNAPVIGGTTDGGSSAGRVEAASASAAGSTTTSVSGAGGAGGAAVNAPDVSDLLGKSAASTGVDIQRRNSIVADPRVRGWRAGQFLASADGGLFVPARADLDSVVSKFDPGTVRDIIVTKGPYASLLGPGFSFIDIATLDSPRYDSLQVHGRTSLGYQTNGQRWDGVQSILTGDRDWGFRLTYNILQGNDYRAGNGPTVPSSYLSNNVNFALGWNLTDTSRVEFKGLHVSQSNLEFPGLYFDVRDSQSDAYSLRYTLTDQFCFDKLTLDLWYNSSATSGDTRLGPKQAFVDELLFQSFNPGRTRNDTDPRPKNLFTDDSNTRFAGKSLGYRLAASWGPQAAPLLTVGTDLNIFGQGLVENIRIFQTSGTNINNGSAISNSQPFTQQQSIPQSNSVDPGLFFQAQMPITDKLKVKGGGRFDYVYSTSNDRTITGNIDLFGPPQSVNSSADRTILDPLDYSTHPWDRERNRQFALFAGYIQAEYKIADRITALVAFGHSERAPSLTELYAAGPFIGVLQQGTSRLIGDPSLKSEKLTQFDIGLRADYDAFQAGVNGFYGWVNDYITYDANRLGNGLTQVVYSNTDRATLAGGELFVQADATAWFSPFATLSYVQGVDQTARDNRRPDNIASSRRDDGVTGTRKSETEYLPQIPPLESRVGFRLHACTKAPRWQVEISARMVAGQNNVASSLGEQRTPGFTVFDIRTFWRARENWLLTAGVENLGDRFYREHLDPIAGNVIGVGGLYRPGTNFYFGSQVTY